jgi:hypothetical protein
MIFIISCNNKLQKITNDIGKIQTIGIIEEDLSDTEFDWRIGENEKINISDIDIFQNIYELPYPYKNLEGFNYNEMFPLINNKGLCIVENENITVMYQAWGSDYFISQYEIKNRNDIYSLGKYIGIKADVIISIFGGEIKGKENAQFISFLNKKDNRITFFVEDNIVTKIEIRSSDVVF